MKRRLSEWASIAEIFGGNRTVCVKQRSKSRIAASLAIGTVAYFGIAYTDLAAASPTNDILVQAHWVKEFGGNYTEGNSEFTCSCGMRRGLVATVDGNSMLMQQTGSHPQNHEHRWSWGANSRIATSSTAYIMLSSCEEDLGCNSVLNPDDVCGPQRTTALFTNFNQMYNQGNFNFQYSVQQGGQATAHLRSNRSENDCYADFQWMVRPRNEFITCAAIGCNGSGSPIIDVPFSVVFSQPSIGIAYYEFRINQSFSTAPNYNTNNCSISDAACGNTSATTGSADPTFENIPSGSWYVHIRAVDNQGYRSRDVRDNKQLIVKNPSLSYGHISARSSGYTFTVTYTSPDEAALAGKAGGMPAYFPKRFYARVGIDIDGNGTVDPVDTSRACDGSRISKYLNLTPQAPLTKRRFLDGLQWRVTQKLCRSRKEIRRNWRYRFMFRSEAFDRTGAFDAAGPLGNHTSMTDWKDF